MQPALRRVANICVMTMYFDVSPFWRLDIGKRARAIRHESDNYLAITMQLYLLHRCKLMRCDYQPFSDTTISNFYVLVCLNRDFGAQLSTKCYSTWRRDQVSSLVGISAAFRAKFRDRDQQWEPGGIVATTYEPSRTRESQGIRNGRQITAGS